jgi:hypothetical protein
MKSETPDRLPTPLHLSEDAKAWEALWNWKQTHRELCGNPFDENDATHLVIHEERFDSVRLGSFTEITCSCSGCGDTSTFSVSDDSYQEWVVWQEAEFQALQHYYKQKGGAK